MRLIERVRSLWGQQDARSAMILALVVWLCTLPVIFLVVTAFLGWRAAGLVALGLLLLLLPICWGICWFRGIREESMNMESNEVLTKGGD